MSRRRRIRQAQLGLLIGAAAFLVASPLYARPVFAANTWTIMASGPSVGESAIVPIGRPPTPTIEQGSVRLEWAPSTYGSGHEVGGYTVKRQVLGSKDVAQICTVASPMRICQDSPPSGEQVVYTVTPTEQLWRGPASPPSAPVTIPVAVLAAPAVATPSPSPSASPTPSASTAPSPSPAATSSPTDTPSPTPTPAPS